MGIPAAVLLLALAAPASARPARPRSAATEATRHYHAGVEHYANDDLAKASASFKEVLRLQPSNAEALAGLRRVEADLAAGPPRRGGTAAPPPARPRGSASFDRLVLVLLPRWIHFEDTIGDALSGTGSIEAQGARVRQLLGERKIALARRRPFRNERQLRALLRRLPSAADEPEPATV